MNGKGDKARPISVSRETWDKNWALIFGKKKKKNDKSLRSQKRAV